LEIQNAHIIITGAGAGFGKSMTQYYASHGATVHAIDMNQEALDTLKSEIDGNLETYTCDVSNVDQVEATLTAIFESDAKINVLINNAGIMKNAPLINFLKRPDGRHDLDLWDKVIQVNQNSVFYMTRTVVNFMIKKRNKGVLIHVSSIAASGNIGQTAYSASKAAVEAMSKVWSKELGAFGIRSVCIAPGFMNTVGGHDALEEKMLANWVSKTPLRRTGEIDEVVKATQFCIENDFFNGEVLKVNGGLTL
jgi:3-oxoacyl-[acyl-carrier protein] reductase